MILPKNHLELFIHFLTNYYGANVCTHKEPRGPNKEVIRTLINDEFLLTAIDLSDKTYKVTYKKELIEELENNWNMYLLAQVEKNEEIESEKE